MTLTLTTADAVLKDDYQGPVRKQINDRVKLAAQVAKNTKDLVGRRAVIPCHISRNTGVGSRAEGEVLPTAGNQGTVEQLVPLRSHYGRIRLSRQVISRMASDRGAFVRATKLEMEGIRDDTSRDYNRQLWGTSDGVIASCDTGGASATVSLLAATPEQVMVNFAEGMRVDIGTAATPNSLVDGEVIQSVDIANRTITVTTSISTTAGTHFVYRAGSGGTSPQRELTGIQTIVEDTGALFGIDPSTDTFTWAAIVEDNSGTARPISENLVARAMHRTENRSGKEVDQLWAEDGVYRSAANLLQAYKRIVNSVDLKGGHKGIEFTAGGMTAVLVRDRDAPVGELYGLCTPELCEWIDEDWSWEDLDGAVLSRAANGTHEFEAYWFKFSEFGTTRRNAHFVIEDLETA